MMLISWKGLPDMFVAIIWNLALQQQHKSAPLDQIVYNMKIIKTIVTILKIWFWPILRFCTQKIFQTCNFDLSEMSEMKIFGYFQRLKIDIHQTTNL